VSDATYNPYLISLIKADDFHVLTIHAEVEGIICLEMFNRFVQRVCAGGDTLVPLGELLGDAHAIPEAVMAPREIPGREGWVSFQESGGEMVS
jgi:undecaprenyl phosphate-alpha-L-ara4FN deformylase